MTKMKDSILLALYHNLLSFAESLYDHWQAYVWWAVESIMEPMAVPWTASMRWLIAYQIGSQGPFCKAFGLLSYYKHAD